MRENICPILLVPTSSLVAQKAIIEFQILADFFKSLYSKVDLKINLPCVSSVGEHGNYVHFYLFNVDMYVQYWFMYTQMYRHAID